MEHDRPTKQSPPTPNAQRLVYVRERAGAASFGILLFICFSGCLMLFHDLLYQNRGLFLLVFAGITASIFGLAFIIRRMLRQYIARRKSARQERKEA